jgi:sulfoquinovosyltransferase
MTPILLPLLVLSLIAICAGYTKVISLHAKSSPLVMQNTALPLDTEPPRRVLLLVEPTPFNYISGYANRFKEMLKFLAKAGDIVHIITVDTDPNAPTDFMGFPITNIPGIQFPYYKSVQVSFDFAEKTKEVIKEFKPDIMHVTTPGFLVYRATVRINHQDTPHHRCHIRLRKRKL